LKNMWAGSLAIIYQVRGNQPLHIVGKNWGFLGNWDAY
jgi:hypothetical protein